MSRNFDRVHKNTKNSSTNSIVKEKLQLSAGLGHYPSDSNEAPTCEMDKSDIRFVLKLIDLGHKKVNFWMKMNTLRSSSQTSSQSSSQGFMINRRESASLEIIDGNMGFSITVGDMGGKFDRMELKLRKRDDPGFKFMAEYQLYTDVRDDTYYDNYPAESRSGDDDWQCSYLKPWYNPLYYVRCNITVV